MEARQRSPSYPSTPLKEAIDIVGKIHAMERTNPVDRAVAAQAMGYSGLSGRSATVLSNLIQFGFLEKTAKNEVRVTRRAVEILYPDTAESKAAALRDAARDPELFRAITERFTDGLPSQAALQAFLMRQGFTHTAVAPASRAFLETFLFLENEIGSESTSLPADDMVEPQQNQHVERGSPMNAPAQAAHRANPPPPLTGKQSAPIEEFDVRISQKMLWLAGTVRNQAEADELIATIVALKPMLRPAPPEAPASSGAPELDDTDVFA